MTSPRNRGRPTVADQTSLPCKAGARPHRAAMASPSKIVITARPLSRLSASAKSRRKIAGLSAKRTLPEPKGSTTDLLKMNEFGAGADLQLIASAHAARKA